MALLLAESGGAANSLPMSPAMYGISALILFAVLLGVTYAFRNVSNRH